MALVTLQTPEAAPGLLEAGVLGDSPGKSASIQAPHGILKSDAEWDRPHRRALRFLLRPIARHLKDSKQQAGLAGASDDEFEVSGSSDNFDSSGSGASLLRADPQQPAAQQQAEAQQPSSTSRLQQQQTQPRPCPLPRLWRGVLGLVARAVKDMVRTIRPRGPGLNDGTMTERIANVITSLPFLGVGLHTIRSRKTAASKHFGWSFVAVGAAAALYHGVSGRWRPAARKCDYWAICYSTGALRRATHVRLPHAAVWATRLLTPFAPTLVTFFNLVAVEARYTSIVLQHEHMYRLWGWHMVASVVGVGSFLWEDEAIARHWPPVFHALWHCLSAAAVGTATNELLSHLDG